MSLELILIFNHKSLGSKKLFSSYNLSTFYLPMNLYLNIVPGPNVL